MNITSLPTHPVFGTALGLRRNGAPIWPVRGASSEGDPPAAPTTDPAPPAPAPADPPKPVAPAPGDEALGDAGKKALDAERLRAKNAEKEVSALAARVKAFEDEKKTDAEKQAERLAQLETEAATAKAEALRFKFASKVKGPDGQPLDEKYVNAFLTGADEKTIAAQAELLIELVGGATPPPPPPTGAYVPGEGRTPTTPGIDDAIAEATKNRDFPRAIALKEQRAAQQRKA
ncbi:hypothetical protein ACFPPE_07375 [Agromyces tardus]|uniref:hypothetical protein n=1 Tax=Agromyces tardus TaxID=2583849 RepID=UPI0036062905